MSTDYRGVLACFVAALKGDSTLTAFLAIRTIGGTASRANSILYNEVVDAPLTPCVLVRDVGFSPREVYAQDMPMYAPIVHIEVMVVGLSEERGPIQWRIDEFLEAAAYQNAMDSADWKIQDIDTAGGWHNAQMGKQPKLDTWKNLEIGIKTYAVKAAVKV